MSESRAIVARTQAGEIDLIHTLNDVVKVSEYVAQSKLFGCESAAQAFVKIVAGREMGFGPIASMSSIHVIEGKPSPGADLIAAAIRRPGSGYDFDINEISDVACKITFYRYLSGQKHKVGDLRYTFEEAKAKGWHLTKGGKEKDTWKQKTANMLFARVITDGKRFFCPDVLTSVFDKDEIDSPAFDQQTIPVQVVATESSRRPTHFHNGGGAVNPAGDTERTTDLVVNEDGSLTDSMDEMTDIRHRIETLIVELGVPADKVRSRLRTNYGGVESIHEIHDLSALKRLESELVQSKSKRQSGNNKTAATAGSAQ